MTVRIARIGACLFAAAVIAAGTSACSAGQIAQTAEMVAAVPGANIEFGDIKLLDVQIAYTGTAGYQVGDDADMILHIVNASRENDTLVGVEIIAEPETNAPGAQDVVLVSGDSGSPAPYASAASGSAAPGDTAGAAIHVPVPAHGSATLVPGEGQFLRVKGLQGAFIPGQSLLVVFKFQNAGSTDPHLVPMAIPGSPAPRTPAAIPGGEAETH